MIKKITNLDINSVILESHEDNSTANITISFQTSEKLTNTERYHIRVFASLTPESAMVLDYISQRYNEFLLGDAGMINSSDFNDYLKSALKDKQEYLSSSTPFSPFSADTVAQSLVLHDGMSKYGDGNTIPEGVIVYDDNLKSALLSQENNNNLLSPIKLEIPLGADIEQMSCYVFIYDNKLLSNFQNNLFDNLCLSTEMSSIERRTLLGMQTEYIKISKNKPFVGMKKAKQTQNPDSSRLKIVSTSPKNSIEDREFEVFDVVRQAFTSNRAFKSHEISKTIKKENYFTELWLTKDDEENIRLLFSLDTDSFLRDNGIFPGIYNSTIKGIVMPNAHSNVVSLDVFRKPLRRDGFVSRGNFGTIERGDSINRLNVDQHNSVKPINSTKEVMLMLPYGSIDEESPVLPFYEGYDVFSNEDIKNHQENGLYGYSVDCQILDDSPELMRGVAHAFLRHKRRVGHVYNSLVSDSSKLFGNSPTYNLSSGRLNIPIQDITIPAGNMNVNAEDEVLNALQEYQTLLQGLSSSREKLNLVEFYKNKLSDNGGLINPSVIKNIESLIDFGIKFVYDSLLKVFPSDPLGRLQNSNKTRFSKNTNRSNRRNILSLSHTFSQTIEKGKTEGLGVDYIFGEGQKGEFKSITNSQYSTRRVEEFRKYFFTSANGEILDPLGTYNDASYAFMTPKIIKTPSRSSINQVSYTSVGGTSINYDYDRYGQLYIDLASIYEMTEKFGMVYPSLSGLAAKQNVNNKLFSSIKEVLGEKFSVSLNENVVPQFSLPKIIQDNTKSTIYKLRERENCGPNGGLLLIQSIIGGENTQNSDDENYFIESNDKIKNENSETKRGEIDRRATMNDQKDRSVRLPFAILGELTLDTRIAQVEREKKSSFNSLSKLRKILNISEQNIEDSTEGSIMAALPNQLKNMIIVTSTKNPLTLGEADGGYTFDARRFLLDEENTENGSDLVSFYSEQSKNATYFQTEDPMKSYATFMAFWMNYRQLAVVEYLDNFSPVDQTSLGTDDSTTRFRLPSWSPLNAEITDGLEERGGSILCRTRTMNADDYISLLGDNISKEQKEELANFFEEKEMLKVPTYNRYFYISEEGTNEVAQNNPQVEEVTAFSTVENLLGY
jgi:hypothetical protein